MSPGEVDALVDGVIRDFQQNPNNDQQLADRYRTMLVDFAKDWREIWHLYGYQREGWPLYRQAIDNVYAKLDKNPRALVTRSNQIGVNPIIVQRILRAALAVDDVDQFIGPLGADS